MRLRIIIILLLFLFSISAKNFPKWKDGNFKTTSSGLQYKIVKKGKGDSIGKNDSVVLEYVLYRGSDKQVQFTTKKLPGKKWCVNLEKTALGDGFKESVFMLKKGGSGYFIIPAALGEHNNDGDINSDFYFIKIDNVIHNYSQFLPIVNSTSDSAHFNIPDPEQNRFGDTLFTTMTLVEVPIINSCGKFQITEAIKFRITFFDNGVQHKDVLIFIDCPEQYGKDFFVPGKSYVITAIPITEKNKQGKMIQNAYGIGIYSRENLLCYYCLRIRKMN